MVRKEERLKASLQFIENAVVQIQTCSGIYYNYLKKKLAHIYRISCLDLILLAVAIKVE